jgi:hypothetical protein
MDKKTKLDEKVIKRFNELIEMGQDILNKRYTRSNDVNMDRKPKVINTFMAYNDVDIEASHQWGLSCLNLLKRIFEPESDHYKRFDKLPSLTSSSSIKKGMGIIKSAKDEYEKGFLFEMKNLIEAEVFDDFLEQAQCLFNAEYFQAAAVIAGSVFEDGLRQLCVRSGINLSGRPKLDSMNSELAKKGTYNKLWLKKITAIAHIRNKAAHGEWNEFSSSDVKDMLDQVKTFMKTYFPR